jgi:hypothetical protein
MKVYFVSCIMRWEKVYHQQQPTRHSYLLLPTGRWLCWILIRPEQSKNYNYVILFKRASLRRPTACHATNAPNPFKHSTIFVVFGFANKYLRLERTRVFLLTHTPRVVQIPARTLAFQLPFHPSSLACKIYLKKKISKLIYMHLFTQRPKRTKNKLQCTLYILKSFSVQQELFPGEQNTLP